MLTDDGEVPVTEREDITVLVVDDEEEVADAYSLQLGREYQTRVAYGGKEALEQLDESINLVLLDRRMPDLTGDDVLQKIRNNGYDCKVIMISAVDPDFDIVDMPFHDYLCKPVRTQELYDAVEQHIVAAAHDDRINEYLGLQSKLDMLEEEVSSQRLADSAEIDKIRNRVNELETDLRNSVGNFDDVVNLECA